MGAINHFCSASANAKNCSERFTSLEVAPRLIIKQQFFLFTSSLTRFTRKMHINREKLFFTIYFRAFLSKGEEGGDFITNLTKSTEKDMK